MSRDEVKTLETAFVERMLSEAIEFAEQVKFCMTRFALTCETPRDPILRLAVQTEFMRVSSRIMMVIGQILEWRATLSGTASKSSPDVDVHSNILAIAGSHNFDALHEPLAKLEQRSREIYLRSERIFGRRQFTPPHAAPPPARMQPSPRRTLR